MCYSSVTLFGSIAGLIFRIFFAPVHNEHRFQLWCLWLCAHVVLTSLHIWVSAFPSHGLRECMQGWCAGSVCRAVMQGWCARLMWMCMCIYICEYACICVCVYLYDCVCMYVCVSIYVSMYVFVYVCMHICVTVSHSCTFLTDSVIVFLSKDSILCCKFHPVFFTPRL